MNTQLHHTNNTQDKEPVQARYDALAQRYVHNYIHPTSLFGLEKQRRLQIVQHYLQELQPDWVLDLGCGPGYVTCRVASDLSNTTVVGVDFSSEMVRFAHQNYQHQTVFLQGDAERLPFQDSHFATVFALGVLGKFNAPQHILEECYRVLEPDGFLLFTYPNTFSFSRVFRRWFISLRNTNKKDNGLHLHSIESIKKSVLLIGFEILNITFITYGNGFVLFPWSKVSNLVMEKCFGTNKIGQFTSMTSFWILKKV